MKQLNSGSESKYSFIFNVRVNPDNAEGTGSIRHLFQSHLISNDNSGIKKIKPTGSGGGF